MNDGQLAMIEFQSANGAGVVNAMLGFEPDWWMLIQNHGGTNPLIHYGASNGQFPGWAAGLSLLHTGSTGVLSRESSGITVFTGGTTIATAEALNSDPKHVDAAGNPVTAVPFITQAGLSIPAALQTAAGRNLLIAFRRNR